MNTTWKKLVLLVGLAAYILVTSYSMMTGFMGIMKFPTPTCETVKTQLVENDKRVINYYSLQQFASRGWVYPVQSNLCLRTKGVQPEFIICAHDPKNDIFVSQSIVSNGYWEIDMAQWLNGLIRKIEADTLYLDIGANLGIHGLHAAKANCTVWIVEPQELNLHKIIHSSILSGIHDKMTIVKNAVDGVRHPMKLWVDKNNNGGSQVRQLGLSKDPSQYQAGEVVQTVLLSDIFEEAFRQSQPKNVIIKADIETFECRAFLGSPQVFAHPSVKGVVFEWLRVTDNCSKDDFKKVLDLFRGNGFKLYELGRDHKWAESTRSDSELMNRQGANLFWSRLSPA